MNSPGRGRARAEGERGLHDALDDVRITVAGNFHRVLAGVGMRRAPKSEHHVIERFALVSERAVNRVAGLAVELGGDELVDDGAAFRAAEADDRESRDAGRRAEGDDGVGGHSEGWD